MTPLYTNSTAPTGPAPVVSNFTATSASIAAGTPVTLSWQVSGASYVIVSPAVGVTRASSISVSPAATTTYTLYVTNAFGQTTSALTITVH